MNEIPNLVTNAQTSKIHAHTQTLTSVHATSNLARISMFLLNIYVYNKYVYKIDSEVILTFDETELYLVFSNPSVFQNAERCVSVPNAAKVDIEVPCAFCILWSLLSTMLLFYIL